MDCAYAHRLVSLLIAVCAGRGVQSKSVSALVTRALATIIDLGKLAAL